MLDSWFAFSVVTALVYGAQAAYLKGVTDEIDQMLVTWSIWLFALPMFAVAAGLEGIPEIQWVFWPTTLVVVACNLAAWPMFVRSVRISDISLVMPLLAFTPAFMIGVELVVRGELPGLWGFGGISLIVFGAYVLNVRADFSALLDPIRSLASDRGARLMLGVAAIWSVSGTLEKITVAASSPSFYIATFGVAFAVGFVPILWIVGDTEPAELKAQWLPLAGAGTLTGAMALVQMQAIRLTPLVNYVISIKRAGMLVSVLFGWLFFDEEHIGFRLAGAALMIVGVGFIRVA